MTSRKPVDLSSLKIRTPYGVRDLDPVLVQSFRALEASTEGTVIAQQFIAAFGLGRRNAWLLTKMAPGTINMDKVITLVFRYGLHGTHRPFADDSYILSNAERACFDILTHGDHELPTGAVEPCVSYVREPVSRQYINEWQAVRPIGHMIFEYKAFYYMPDDRTRCSRYHAGEHDGCASLSDIVVYLFTRQCIVEGAPCNDPD
jgi:hypothetical protein